jgi:hypothetical protein
MTVPQRDTYQPGAKAKAILRKAQAILLTPQMVLLVGSALVLFSGLFPPWLCVVKFKTTVTSRPAGHRFLFFPPSGVEYRATEVVKVWRLGEGPWDKVISNNVECRLDTTRLVVEWSCIVLVTAGLALAFHLMRKEQRQGPQSPVDSTKSTASPAGDSADAPSEVDSTKPTASPADDSTDAPSETEGHTTTAKPETSPRPGPVRSEPGPAAWVVEELSDPLRPYGRR